MEESELFSRDSVLRLTSLSLSGSGASQRWKSNDHPAPSPFTMLPSPSGFSSGCCDLLCREDATQLSDFCSDSGESIVGFVDRDSEVTGSLDPAARRDAVAWILKVRAYYRFRPVTACLAVIYLDRFLSSHILPQNGWALQLVSVACLAVAAKMEETLVPTLLDLQVEGAKFIFEPRTVLRMELLVLTALDWRLQSITPFHFLNFFAHKIDSFSKKAKVLVSQATKVILAALHEISFLSHCPSTLAAAAIICATEETPNRALVDPSIAASWYIGLTEEKISSCYRTIRQVIADRNFQKTPMILLQHRVISPVKKEMSSCSSSPHTKRRKLNNQSCN